MEIFIFYPILMGEGYYLPRSIWGRGRHKIIEKLSKSKTWRSLVYRSGMWVLQRNVRHVSLFDNFWIILWEPLPQIARGR